MSRRQVSFVWGKDSAGYFAEFEKWRRAAGYSRGRAAKHLIKAALHDLGCDPQSVECWCGGSKFYGDPCPLCGKK